MAETVQCTSCGEALPPRARFCPGCGQPLQGGTRTDANQQRLPPRLLQTGTRIGDRYLIQGVIGEGGMGVVYRATDLQKDRLVAIKALHANLMGDAEIRRRFIREAQLMLGWNHKHVARVHDLVEHEDLLAFVMEYVDGPSLEDHVQRWGGKHSVRQRSKQLPGGLSGSASVSQSETRMELLEAGEMLQRSAEEVLVFTHGVPPTWLKKVRYWKEAEYRGSFDPHTGADPVPLENVSAGEPTPPRHPYVAEDPVHLSDEDQELLDNVNDVISQLPDGPQQALIRRLRNV